MREVWALPIRGNVFNIDESNQPSPARAAARDAVLERGGIVHAEVSPACDYYLTDSPDSAEAAKRAGAKQVINNLVFSVMISGRS